MHIRELEDLIEEQVSEAVLRHHPLDWDENAITHDLLIRLRRVVKGTHTIFGLRQKLDVEWEIYKLRGKRETNFGDIGLLFRYLSPGSGVLEGASFLEAKVRSRDSNKFRQVRHEQVETLLKRSTQSRLLLYDYNPVAVLPYKDNVDLEWFWFPRHHGRHLHHLPTLTHAPIVPLQLASAVNAYDDGLYRFAHSLGHQFCQRFLHMHDLDFGGDAVATVKGYPADLDSPNFIMVVHVAPAGTEHERRFVPPETLYSGLE